ncbi:MAG: TetR/AcrR family transcriptional regulator [Actinomycetota bacterium]
MSSTPPDAVAVPAADPGRPTAPVKRGRGRPRSDGPTEAFLARRAEIVDRAIDVFRERGFESASLEDVAVSLAMSRASLYHYVPSKAHLLYLVFDRAISIALDRMEALSAIVDPGERLAALIDQQVRTIADNQSMFDVFFGDRPALDPQFEAEIVAKERRLLRYLIEAVAAAQEAELIAPGDPRATAQAVLGMTSWLHKWYDPDRDDAAEYAEVCKRLVFSADSAGRGAR